MAPIQTVAVTRWNALKETDDGPTKSLVTSPIGSDLFWQPSRWSAAPLRLPGQRKPRRRQPPRRNRKSAAGRKSSGPTSRFVTGRSRWPMGPTA